jgi:hypothetical protein
VLEAKHNYKNISVDSRLIFILCGGRMRLCIPECLINSRSARKITISHAHSTLAHLGSSHTVGYARNHLWWKTMVADTTANIETCNTCKRSKPNNQKLYGLQNPLAVPTTLWEAVGIDFVEPLTPSHNYNTKFNSIVTISDLLTGIVHLVPGKTTYKAPKIAELIFAEIYKCYGLPSRFASDHDKWLNSIFWTCLHKLLGVKLQHSSAYHPE